MNRVTVKRGDLIPSVRVQVLDSGTGAAIPLNGADELEFRMTPVSEGLRSDVAGAATLPLTDKSVIDYAWSAGDTATAGLYKGEFRARYGTAWKTLPTDGFVFIEIEQGATAT